jgi:predicted RNA-binding Zn-ribbon protein involved in translation (DUF1610 family)
MTTANVSDLERFKQFLLDNPDYRPGYKTARTIAKNYNFWLSDAHPECIALTSHEMVRTLKIWGAHYIKPNPNCQGKWSIYRVNTCPKCASHKDHTTQGVCPECGFDTMSVEAESEPIKPKIVDEDTASLETFF